MRQLTATDQVYSSDWDFPHIYTLLGFSTLLFLKTENTFWGVIGGFHRGQGLHRACGFPTERKPILHHIKMKAGKDRHISRKGQVRDVSNWRQVDHQRPEKNLTATSFLNGSKFQLQLLMRSNGKVVRPTPLSRSTWRKRHSTPVNAYPLLRKELIPPLFASACTNLGQLQARSSHLFSPSCCFLFSNTQLESSFSWAAWRHHPTPPHSCPQLCLFLRHRMGLP